MVDAAAALWSAVRTAGVRLVDQGPLNEDVSSANIVAGNAVIAQPSDVTPSATAYPLGVIYDADGSVINALFGTGASDPPVARTTVSGCGSITSSPMRPSLTPSWCSMDFVPPTPICSQ